MRLISIIFSFASLSIVINHMLKQPECGLYDAEFSLIKYGYRLTKNILSTLSSVTLRHCLTHCTLHPTCQSVNYMRDNSKCELIDSTIQSCDIDFTNLFIQADGWNHVETKDKDAVSCQFLSSS